MSTLSNYEAITQTPEYQAELAAQKTFMARVYGWMTIGLLVTAVTALALASIPSLQQQILGNGVVVLVLLGTSIAISLGLQFLINRIPAILAAIFFITYSAIIGTLLSVIFLVYSLGSIGATFFVTAGMFGAMSLWGYTTKRDLSGWGSILFMGLIGLFLASIVNVFMAGNNALYWLTTYAGVVIFTALTAYDTQKIKEAYAVGDDGSVVYKRTAIFGAFMLYLDFINLFLYLLRLLGSRKN